MEGVEAAQQVESSSGQDLLCPHSPQQLSSNSTVGDTNIESTPATVESSESFTYEQRDSQENKENDQNLNLDYPVSASVIADRDNYVQFNSEEGDNGSNGSDQEGNIENLAEMLADNLHREHPTVHSMFSFEEFDSEQQYHQHQERLQLHLYQQHVLHQQELQRQQDRFRRNNLHISTDDASRYSALPSPGSKFYRQPGQQSPGSSQGPYSPAWYRAEDAASYVNRSGSLCSRKDRLYEVCYFFLFSDWKFCV